MTTEPTPRAHAGVDTTALFTGRAECYRRYRPGYPRPVTDLLECELGLTPASVVADIGSGTGLSTEIFLQHGNTVFAVEPNTSMRRVAEEQWSGNPLFHSVDGTAEHTTLPDASVDLVSCATSFHWFDAKASRLEFERILRRGGWVVLLWNVRRAHEPPVMAAYEHLLERLDPGHAVRTARDKDAVERVRAFFAPRPFDVRAFENPQRLDLEGLKGRFTSASYAPVPGEARFEPAMREVEALFDRFSREGAVTLVYDTFVYWGRLA